MVSRQGHLERECIYQTSRIRKAVSGAAALADSLTQDKDGRFTSQSLLNVSFELFALHQKRIDTCPANDLRTQGFPDASDMRREDLI
jgi:hypothetical protein